MSSNRNSKKEIDLEEVYRQFISLRESLHGVQIATLDSNLLPDVSYAPFVWYENACYLFLSDLAAHARNLRANPAISVLMIESEENAGNQFSRRRIILKGKVNPVARSERLFNNVIDQFRNRFGKFIDLIEPFQDFQLFQLKPVSGQFIRGFAQAFELTGRNLDEFVHINPAAKS